MDRALGRALILGDDTRSFLASVRSLGRNCVEVHAAPSDFTSPSLRSRYIAAVHRVPYYLGDGRDWLDAVQQLIRDVRIDVVLPCNERSLLPLHRHRDEFRDVALAIPDEPGLAALFDKAETRRLAERLGVPVAPGRLTRPDDSAEQLVEEFGLPLFVKPCRSYSLERLHTRGEVVRAASVRRLAEVLDSRGTADHLIEAAVPGSGVGLSVFATRGVVHVAFQHRRVRESAAGGYYRVSEQPSHGLLTACERIIQELAYTGLAMFEFREDRASGRWALLEVNARPWGSMPLPVSLGVHFPFYWFQFLTAGKVPTQPTYASGRYGRNLLPDIRQVLAGAAAATRSRRTLAAGVGQAVAEVGRILVGRESQDTLVLDDPAPGLAELSALGRSGVQKVVPRLLGRATRRRRAEAALQHALSRDPYRQHTIVFVCQGNICRSPFAALALERHLRSHEGVSVSSGGMLPRPGRQSPDAALDAARELDYDLSSHRSAHFGFDAVAGATAIVVFDDINRRALRQRYPRLSAPVVLLADFEPSGAGAREIADPDGRDLETFRATYARIEAACASLATVIRATTRSAAGGAQTPVDPRLMPPPPRSSSTPLHANQPTTLP